MKNIKTPLSKGGKQIAKIASQTITPQAIEKITDLVGDTILSEAKDVKAPTSNSGLKKITKAAGDVLKVMAPELAGMIPGVGPLAKMVLSTMNDDEWFSEFKSAGATFNELLQTENTGKLIRMIPAYAEIQTEIGWDNFKDDVLPSMLAYIRNKTNNVLASDVDDYSKAIKLAMELYALYHTLGKYLAFAEDLPLNIPTPTELLPVIRPEALSQAKGIHEALGYYLKVSIRLPYAITEYLRWRFGTTFLTSNTGKPGFIFYNSDIGYHWVSDGDSSAFLAALTARIDDLQRQVAEVSRAMSDIKVAYDDHQIRYDVEKKHYDEKEFNLRTNFTYGSNRRTQYDETKNLYTLFLDSRLDLSAAIQAVTLSTARSAPFPIQISPRIAWYTPRELFLGYTEFTYKAGWHFGALQFDEPVAGNIKLRYDNVTPSTKGVYASMDEVRLTSSTFITFIENYMATFMADALQVHNIGTVIKLADANNSLVAELVNSNLAYDRAAITAEQLSSIHRIAVRNLFRGDYKMKTQPAQKSEVKEAIAKVETAAIEELI